MASAKSERRCSTADVEPVVVVLSHMEVSSIFGGVVIAVANERCLPVVVQVCVGNGDPFGCVGYIDEPIVVVFAVGQVGVKLASRMSVISFIGFGKAHTSGQPRRW